MDYSLDFLIAECLGVAQCIININIYIKNVKDIKLQLRSVRIVIGFENQQDSEMQGEETIMLHKNTDQ